MQQELLLSVSPQKETARSREGWEFRLTEREVMLLRKPITDTTGGWQGAMREAATRIYPDGTWRVSDALMRRLYRMCVAHGSHGGYQGRLPMRVLGPIFATHHSEWIGTWFYGKREGDDTHRIKFGKTDRPDRRNRDFSTDNPRRLYTVFCIWDQSGTYEQRVKKHFAQYCATREWFFCMPAVENFVQLCCRVSTTQELPEL